MKLKTEPGEDFRAPYLRRLGFEDRIAGKPEGKSLFLYEMGEPTIGPFLRQHYFDSYHNAEEAQKKLAKAVSNLPVIIILLICIELRQQWIRFLTILKKFS